MLRILSTALLLCILFPASLSAADWRQYQSDNFIIYSDAWPGRVELVLREFEEFRTIARFFLRQGDQPEHERVRIYMFDSQRDYNRLLGEDAGEVAGFYINALGGPRLVIGPEQAGMTFREVLYHEYIHYLMGLNAGLNYPRWYTEGMAELLSTAYTKFDYVAIGEAPAERVDTLQRFSRMKVEDLISLESAENGRGLINEARLYANAWLLTHFLTIGNFNDEYGLRGPLREYLLSYQQGRDPVASFPAIFDMNTEEMDAMLERYISSGRLQVVRFDSAGFIYEGAVDARDMSNAESAFLLASLASEMAGPELTLDFLQQEAPENHSPQAAAMAAVAAGHLEDFTVADQQAQFALEQEELDEEALTLLSHYWLDVGVDREHDAEAVQEALAQATDLGVQAVGRDDGYIPAYYYLAKALAARGRLEDAENVLWVAFDQYPGSFQVNAYMLQLLVMQDSYETALPILNKVYSTTHVAETREGLSKLRLALEAALDGEDADPRTVLCEALSC